MKVKELGLAALALSTKVPTADSAAHLRGSSVGFDSLVPQGPSSPPASPFPIPSPQNQIDNFKIDNLVKESGGMTGTISKEHYTSVTHTIVFDPETEVSTELRKTLLELKAKNPDAASNLIQIPNRNGHNALFEAIKNNKEHWVNFIIENFPEETASMLKTSLRSLNKESKEKLAKLLISKQDDCVLGILDNDISIFSKLSEQEQLAVLKQASQSTKGKLGQLTPATIINKLVSNPNSELSTKLKRTLEKLKKEDSNAAKNLIERTDRHGQNVLVDVITKEYHTEWIDFLIENFPDETVSMLDETVSMLGSKTPKIENYLVVLNRSLKIKLAKLLIEKQANDSIVSMLLNYDISIFLELSEQDQRAVLEQASQSTKGKLGELKYTVLTKAIVSDLNSKLSQSLQNALLYLKENNGDAASKLIQIPNKDGHNALFEAIKNNKEDWVNFIIKNFPDETVSMFQSTIQDKKNISIIKENLKHLDKNSQIKLAKLLIPKPEGASILSMLFDNNISIFLELSEQEKLAVLKQASQSTEGTLGELKYTVLTKAIVSKPNPELSQSLQKALLELKENNDAAASKLIQIPNIDEHNALFEAIKHKEPSWLGFFHNHFTNETRTMLSGLASKDGHDLDPKWLLSVSQNLIKDLEQNQKDLEQKNKDLEQNQKDLEQKNKNLEETKRSLQSLANSLEDHSANQQTIDMLHKIQENIKSDEL